MRQQLLLFLFLSFSILNFSQELKLSTNSEISVLTVGQGASLNDAFGHSAFRIKDSSLGLDIIYGYGEYDFDTPNFYLKFAQGKLNYLISKDSFKDFYRRYSYFNRTIKEQVLNLTIEEKQKLFNFLRNNYKPENRRYLYDFFYDNCATRIRDVVELTTDNSIVFNTPKNFEQKTFRALIHDQVDKNSWGSFGIDLALGSVIDKKATAYEHMYLPDYIYRFFESANFKNGKSLVKSENIIFKKRQTSKSNFFFTSPLFILGVIGVLILLITFLDYKNKKHSKWLDGFLFLTTGLIGVLMLLLWFATDHTATAQNYNLLWAFPINLFVLFKITNEKPSNWVIKYLKFLVIMLCLLTLHWIIGIQVYAIGLIPLLLVLVVRYLYLIRYFNSVK